MGFETHITPRLLSMRFIPGFINAFTPYYMSMTAKLTAKGIITLEGHH